LPDKGEKVDVSSRRTNESQNTIIWKCHKDICRIDGFASLDFTLIPNREILLGTSELISRRLIAEQQENDGLNRMITKAKNIFK
jgi:hypothetical protein